MVFEMTIWINGDDICCSKKDLFSRERRSILYVLFGLLRRAQQKLSHGRNIVKHVGIRVRNIWGIRQPRPMKL